MKCVLYGGPADGMEVDANPRWLNRIYVPAPLPIESLTTKDISNYKGSGYRRLEYVRSGPREFKFLRVII